LGAIPFRAVIEQIAVNTSTAAMAEVQTAANPNNGRGKRRMAHVRLP
jgi:hypothetical protein